MPTTLDALKRPSIAMQIIATLTALANLDITLGEGMCILLAMLIIEHSHLIDLIHLRTPEHLSVPIWITDELSAFVLHIAVLVFAILVELGTMLFSGLAGSAFCFAFDVRWVEGADPRAVGDALLEEGGVGDGVAGGEVGDGESEGSGQEGEKGNECCDLHFEKGVQGRLEKSRMEVM